MTGLHVFRDRQAREAIPPAYTEFVGTQLLAHLKATVEA